MFSVSDTLYLAVNFQFLLTVFLVALLWALYYWLQRLKFFRWWAWAWTASAVFLASATASLRLGPAWTPAKIVSVAFLLLAGFSQPFLLVCGGLSWRSPGRPSRRFFWTGSVFVVLIAAACMLLGLHFRGIPVVGFAVRNAPRSLAMATALSFSSFVFWQQFRMRRSYAAAITGVFCLAYAADHCVYSLSFCKIIFDRFHVPSPQFLARLVDGVLSVQSHLLFLDLIDTCGICLGMILLLVERFRQTASELELSERRRRGLAVDNASLQSEIEIRDRAVEELRRSEAFSRQVILNSPLAMVVSHGPSEELLLVNGRFTDLFGYTAEDMREVNDWWVVAYPDPQYRDIIQSQWNVLVQQITQAGADKLSMQARVRCKDASFRDIEFHLSFVNDLYLITFVDLTEHKRAEQAMRRSEEKLLALRNRLARAQEEERARIARDLHDDTGQRLALLSIDLEQLKQASMKLKSSLTQQLEALVKAASEIASDVHNVSRRLHPSQVELLGLVPALSNFCRDFSARNEMEVEFYHESMQHKPPQDAALCLFRVTQEAVRNVLKHSGTRRALVQLDENSGSLRLRVSDHGLGFDPEANEHPQGLGLLSMQERLHSLGGELFVHSRPGGGTCIEACVPLKADVPA